MSTIYDWITVGLFAGLIVLFLQRSVGDAANQDAFWPYIVASGGCAGVNWLGNHDYHALAVLAGGALLLFIFFVLKPFAQPGQGH